MGIFQTIEQRDRLRGFQNAGRRAYRRGGMIPFSLPSDRSWQVAPSLFRGVPKIEDVLTGPDLSSLQEQSFRMYGGFSVRAPESAEAGMAAVLGRRRAMLAATSSNAPVHRARWELGVAAVTKAPAINDPTGATRLETPTGEQARLEDALHQRVTDSFGTGRADGWHWFEKGEYRRAARAFESAVMFDADDVESRIGEVFCYLSLGSERTATVLVEQLARRDPNPFVHDVPVAERYPSQEDLRSVRLGVQTFAERQGGFAHAEALRIFTLWHLGQRDEAEVLASSVSVTLAGTPFVNWPAQLRAMRAQLRGATDLP